jgi:hypothetical protein
MRALQKRHVPRFPFGSPFCTASYMPAMLLDTQGGLGYRGRGSWIQRFRDGSGVGFGFRVSASGVRGWGLEELGNLREGLLLLSMTSLFVVFEQQKKKKKKQDSKIRKKDKRFPLIFFSFLMGIFKSIIHSS